MPQDCDVDLREALKRTAVALKESGLPFALSGSYAAWARGAPEPSHDVDFVVAEADAEQAADWLREAGLQVERPPEDWLFKVFTDGAMVDVLHRVNGVPVRRSQLDDVEELDVISVRMPVQSATVLLEQKLCSLDEHYCDFSTVIPIARALREQVDWERLAHHVRGNDFAEVLLDLLGRLGVTDPSLRPAVPATAR
ncbi:nucleotidyltransferase family protein [Nostocoides japonicum]|nr:nucleotidyltransferase family protein [Tetrasphaera japonica]